MCSSRKWRWSSLSTVLPKNKLMRPPQKGEAFYQLLKAEEDFFNRPLQGRTFFCRIEVLIFRSLTSVSTPRITPRDSICCSLGKAPALFQAGFICRERRLGLFVSLYRFKLHNYGGVVNNLH
jgi:hypothetical protein